ncbi:hepatic lectin-like [Anneissia japonica]|uniref:hepatic lectin-like n=1 Tax=Anneissia japonica TaxID=1529436 RepID=UPI001425B5E5|nr:hepatic lectin-like [Anneissia japonica]
MNEREYIVYLAEVEIVVINHKIQTSVTSVEWHHFEGSSYTVSKVTYSWNNSLQYCESIGASLTRISSLEENQFVHSLFPKGREHMWIGLNRQKTEGVWEWTMKPCNFDFRYWDDDTSTYLPKYKKCARMVITGKWMGSVCNSWNLVAVCEKESIELHMRAVKNTMGQLVCMNPDALAELTITSKQTRSLIECLQYCVAVGRCNAFQVQQTSDGMMCHVLEYGGDITECLESRGCNLYVMV